MKVIYLGRCRAYHPNYDVDYNDITKTSDHINIIGDMLKVDLSCYDVLIATPPCNYYSRANYRRDISSYALNTKHLLPGVLYRFMQNYNKPFLVENVRNWSLFQKCGITKFCNDNGIFIYEYGRHTYFTNIMLNLNNIPQVKDNIAHISNSKNIYREGGYNVYNVIEYFLKYCKEFNNSEV